MINKVIQVNKVEKVIKVKVYSKKSINTFIASITFPKFSSAFTIVELLIYMSLMGIFLIVLLDIFTTTINTKLSSESTSALNQDSRYILSKLSYDISNADSVITPTLGSNGNVLQITNGGLTATYASNSGNFSKTIGGEVMSLNGLDTSLDAINFKNIGNSSGKPTIQISYTLKSKITAFDKLSTQTTNTTVGLR